MTKHHVTNCVFSRHSLMMLKLRIRCDFAARRMDGGGWCVGYAHQAFALPGISVTADQAEHMLRHDLVFLEQTIRQLVEVSLTDHAYDALVIHAFNLGPRRFTSSLTAAAVNVAAPHTVDLALKDDLPASRLDVFQAEALVALARSLWNS